jgi:organic radical activating enzyme
MAVQAKEKEIELVVTWVCNWHCEYCCVDTHSRPKLAMDEVRAKLDNLIPGYNVTISGGEPGSMKRKDLEFIIDEIKKRDCIPSINTNGLFIKRYRDLCDEMDCILYHCSQDIDTEDDIIVDDTLDIEYMLVVTDNNFDRLGQFLDKYPDITFNLIAATNPDGIYGPTLSVHNKHKMMRLYHHRMTEESIKRVFKEKDFDSIIYI